jgi:hypothetical protein
MGHRTEKRRFGLPPICQPTLGELSFVTVLTLAAAGFYFKGVLPGSICLFAAVGSAIAFWTPLRDHLGWLPGERKRASSVPRRRLEAHAKRGNELLARIDQAMAMGYTGSLAPDSTLQMEIQRLAGDMTRWMATAEAWVKELVPHLLDEYQTDYGPGESANRESAAGLFYSLWEPLRQRVDALQRVIDAMEDQ